MALISCEECGRQISDKALACPGCGAPPGTAVHAASAPPGGNPPASVRYDAASDCFEGTIALILQLAIRAIQDLGWKVEQTDSSVGLVSFQTGGMSWNSWSGVSGSLYFKELAPYRFGVSGTARQNPSGVMRLSLDLGGEAGAKVSAVIERMRQMAIVDASLEGPCDAADDDSWVPGPIIQAYDSWLSTRADRDLTRFLNAIEANFERMDHGEKAAGAFAVRFSEARDAPGFQAWVSHISRGS